MAKSSIGVSAAASPDAAPALTALTTGAGCGCKLPAADILPIVGQLPRQRDERLLVGSATSDDAAVFQLAEGLALVQTVDFFTPLVDDPYDFGRIAAANALSDVYAMGATPLTALNIVAFPLVQLGPEVLSSVMRGGLDVVAEAGATVVGGHSIEDPVPKYGLAVTGVLDPARILTNAGARPGDLLTLSKPLGAGAIVTACKRGRAPRQMLDSAILTMVRLNAQAASAAIAAGAHALTDVTGFGLLGHLHHLCRESGLAAVLDAELVPCLPGVDDLLRGDDGLSGGSRRNAEWAEGFASFDAGVSRWRRRLLTDATTSGGLLAALPARSGPAESEPALGLAGSEQAPGWTESEPALGLAEREPALGPVIGRLVDGPPGVIQVC